MLPTNKKTSIIHPSCLAGRQANIIHLPDLKEEFNKNKIKINISNLDSSGWKLVDDSVSKLLNKISSGGIPLIKYVNGKIYYGIKTGLNKAFDIDEDTKTRLIKEDEKSSVLLKPFLAGRDIKRYAPLLANNYLIHIPKGFTNKNSNSSRNP